MEIKVIRVHSETEEEPSEKVVMLRYVVFSGFDQQLYPLIYVTVLMRLIGATLANGRV